MTATTATPNHSQPPSVPSRPPPRRICLICSKGTLDMAYPGLVLANAARMNGIGAMIFFTFWGLDLITKKKVDRLRVATVGNPSLPIPTWLGAIPGVAAFVTRQMKRGMAKLDIPTIPEFLEMLEAGSCEMYACKMAMDMLKLTPADLVPQVTGVLTAMEFMDKSEGAQIIFI